jgi:hypothetical protein
MDARQVAVGFRCVLRQYAIARDIAKKYAPSAILQMWPRLVDEEAKEGGKTGGKHDLG